MGYLYWIYNIIRNEFVAIPGHVIALIFFVSLLLIPAFTGNPYILRIFTLAAIFAIFAASWDVLVGYTGQINLGHALFFGVGAYSVALLNLHFGLPAHLSIPLGSIAAVLVGLIIGIPALRLRGFYLALVTLAFPIILTGILFFFADFTGGEQGLTGVHGLALSRTTSYYIIVLTMVFSLLLMYKFTDAGSKWLRVGIILHAIREDEITARSSGINTTLYKLLSFAFSGFFAGVAGGLYAVFMRTVGPSTLELSLTFQAILWTIFGGSATIYGAVTGVYILYPLIEFLNLYPVVSELRFILFALILIFTLLFMPEGLSRWIRDKIEIHCTRCKGINIASRRTCRICSAPLHLAKTEGSER
jgi:branched-chain amino acid transport system permease protein